MEPLAFSWEKRNLFILNNNHKSTTQILRKEFYLTVDYLRSKDDKCFELLAITIGIYFFIFCFFFYFFSIFIFDLCFESQFCQ